MTGTLCYIAGILYYTVGGGY